MITFKNQYINKVSKFYTDKTRMTKKICHNKNMYKL